MSILRCVFERTSRGGRSGKCERGAGEAVRGLRDALFGTWPTIDSAYHYGDEAVLKAVRVHSSTACQVHETERSLDGTEGRKCTRAV